jgi:hypothetical protein
LKKCISCAVPYIAELCHNGRQDFYLLSFVLLRHTLYYPLVLSPHEDLYLGTAYAIRGKIVGVRSELAMNLQGKVATVTLSRAKKLSVTCTSLTLKKERPYRACRMRRSYQEYNRNGLMEEVVAIRKRPSEDHRLFPTGERTRAAVLQDRSWITCSGQSCSIVENTYKVLDHSIPVDCQWEVRSFETLCCFTKCLRIYGTRLSLSSKTQISTGK